MMMLDFCPGAQKFRQPQPEYIECPSCGYEIEIWTDEIKAICPNCKKEVTHEAAISCLEWCTYARECVGSEIYNRYMKNRAITIKDKLLKELDDYFGDDLRRIEHAKEVMGYAERLLLNERADWHIVIPAAILHDIGIKMAEEKYGSNAGYYQEIEGPAIARKILIKIGLSKKDIDEICEIIGHHHSPGKINTQNFKVLYDADWIVNLKDEVDTNDKERLRTIIKRIFLTDTGKRLAEKIYL